MQYSEMIAYQVTVNDTQFGQFSPDRDRLVLVATSWKSELVWACVTSSGDARIMIKSGMLL